MLRYLRARIELPRVPPRIAMGGLLVWGLSLLLVDCGAKIEMTRPVPMVEALDLCDAGVAPPPAAVLRVLSPGETALIRTTRDASLRGRCYEVETADGLRGWLPWHPAYMRSAGIFVRVGPGANSAAHEGARGLDMRTPGR